MHFLGTHRPRLDDKGRLILPAKYRERLERGLIITKGQERCLLVYTPSDFESIADSLSVGPVSTAASRAFRRVFLASASDEMPDKQGRVTVPPALRTYAGLDRDVAVVGAGDHLEIWDGPTWERYSEQVDEEFALSNETPNLSAARTDQPPRPDLMT